MSWPNQNNSDRKLWDDLRNGSVEALDQIYYNYVQILFNYGDKITTNKSLVEDAVQEIFIEIWQKREKIGPTDAIKFYLLKSIKRRINKKLNKEHKYLNYFSNTNNEFNYEEFYLELTSNHQLSNKEYPHDQYKELNRVVQTLSPRQKEAVFLKFYDNLSFKEVSEVMDISIKYTYKLISQTLDKLRKEIIQKKLLYLSILLILVI